MAEMGRVIRITQLIRGAEMGIMATKQADQTTTTIAQ
jgi:hypothetical protein